MNALSDILLSVACAHDHGLVLGSPMMTPYSYAELLAESGPVTPELVELAARRLQEAPPPASEAEMEEYRLRSAIKAAERGIVGLEKLAKDPRTSPKIVADMPRVLAICEAELRGLRDALTALLCERAKRRAA